MTPPGLLLGQAVVTWWQPRSEGEQRRVSRTEVPPPQAGVPRRGYAETSTAWAAGEVGWVRAPRSPGAKLAVASRGRRLLLQVILVAMPRRVRLLPRLSLVRTVRMASFRWSFAVAVIRDLRATMQVKPKCTVKLHFVIYATCRVISQERPAARLTPAKRPRRVTHTRFARITHMHQLLDVQPLDLLPPLSIKGTPLARHDRQLLAGSRAVKA